MKLKFVKMHGCGNDYIFFNSLDGGVKDGEGLARKLSDRHFGIGGDGVVLIENSEVADARMRMFNADGSEGKMCGNAIRCVGKYLLDRKIVGGDILKIETLSGIKTLEMVEQVGKKTFFKVNMGRAEFSKAKIPVEIESSEERIISHPIKVCGQEVKITAVSMGNPHCVVFVEDLNLVDVQKIGEKLECYEIFPNRTNVEFVEVVNRTKIKMRVFERGSGETLACGTGACAAVAAAVLNSFCNLGDEVAVCLLGGVLKITFFEDRVLMAGEAVEVFEGEVEV